MDIKRTVVAYDGSQEYRTEAIEIIGKLRLERGVPEFRLLLNNDPDAYTAGKIMDALRAIGSPESLAMLDDANSLLLRIKWGKRKGIIFEKM